MSEASAEAAIPRELVLRARRREPAALETLFDRLFPRVYAAVSRLVRPRETAEDVTQEVFFRVHRAIERLDPDRDPLPWVMTIAMNCCRKHWSSAAAAQARRTGSLDDHPAAQEPFVTSESDPDQARSRSVRSGRVLAALDALPESMREVVVLHVYGGMGHDEIATALGLGHAAVRKRYSRALARLAELLEDGDG